MQKSSSAHYPSNSTPTAKHGGGSVMLWRDLIAEDTGRVLRLVKQLITTHFLGQLDSETKKRIDEVLTAKLVWNSYRNSSSVVTG